MKSEMRKWFLAWILIVPLTLAAQSQKDHHFEVGKHLDIFNQVYKNLELLYVDTLNPKETIGTAINAMLHSLDPYTEYYGEENTKDLRLMLTGKYAGIGALIQERGCHPEHRRLADDRQGRGLCQ